MRGCQKKIVYFKNTGSKIFDEAYFVISDKNDKKSVINDDMIAEANRIIEECSNERCDKRKRKDKKGMGGFVRALICFILGALVSSSVATVIFITLI